MRRFLRIAVVTVVSTFALAGVAHAARSGSPGAASIGDPLFPGLGNGGYDVRHMSLNLRYPTADPLQTVQGAAVIDARATQDLSRSTSTSPATASARSPSTAAPRRRAGSRGSWS